VLKGLLGYDNPIPVTFVNAPQIAEERGLTLTHTKTAQSEDYRNKITLRSSCGHSIAGTLAGLRGEARIVMVDDHAVEVPPSRHLLIVRNDDRPGMIGIVGTTLAKHNVNISNMALGKAQNGSAALMVLDTEGGVPEDCIDELRLMAGITGVDPIDEA
jgi:D-3-phosphoglycerate dehydrogenase / 2-oxoglutarate reductase